MEDTYCLWQMSDKHKNCFIRIFFILLCLERTIVVDYKSFVFATVVVVVVFAVAVILLLLLMHLIRKISRTRGQLGVPGRKCTSREQSWRWEEQKVRKEWRGSCDWNSNLRAEPWWTCNRSIDNRSDREWWTWHWLNPPPSLSRILDPRPRINSLTNI